ncbi:class I SAM-dependent methyltransferase [Halomonas cibimaris]|uniref:Class I SAM-dependent methyltransferase n=1 Tax=Halomonas cibimaris TaxID=657012 RepID=A0ABP7LHH5_9GAMM
MNVSQAEKPYVQWQEGQTPRQALWLSESGYTAPAHIVPVDDQTTADHAYRLACEGNYLLWRGDFHNALQLMQAMNRRIKRTEQRKASKAARSAKKTSAENTTANAFHQQRQAQAQRARTLGRLLLELDAGYACGLRRAPDLSAACEAAFGPLDEPCLISLRDLQGALGAAQWREKGVRIDGLDQPIFPHYGVFAPTRHEYVPLMQEAPLPAKHDVAFDIGTGTGLLAIILAKRGAGQVVATDSNPRALACAEDNLERSELSGVQLQEVDLFPTGQPLADLIVCNPPWLPGKPSSSLELAVYDPKSRMLRGFLQGVRAHLAPQGEVWLILSDLAEHLQLRTRDQLLAWFAEAKLDVKYRLDTQPKHGRSQDSSDPLHAARSAEVTSLWCLTPA